jgi:hypothetical protein
MQLKELLRDLFETDTEDKMIGIYKGPYTSICPDFADEILETHGDYPVVDYHYYKDKNILIVELEMEV